MNFFSKIPFGACCGRQKRPAFFILGMLIALLFAAPVLRSFFVEGYFRFHVSLPSALHGGIELIILTIAIMGVLASKINRRFTLGFVAVLLFLYARRHNLELTILASLFLLEGYLAVGALVCRLTRMPIHAEYARLVHFLVGVCCWLLLVFWLSFVELAATENLLIASFVLFLPAYFFSKHSPLTFQLIRSWLVSSLPERLLGVGFVIWMFVLYAKSHHVISHDSLWYGLRGEHVLSVGGSVFNSAGLSNQVFYYPKLYEILILPLSGLDYFSLIIGFGVAIWGLAAYTCCHLLRLFGIRGWRGMMGTWLVCSLPVVSSLAVEAKPDLLAATLMLIGGYFGIYSVRRGGSYWLLLLAASIMAVCTKIVALPYMTLLFVCLVFARFFSAREDQEGLIDIDTRVGFVGVGLAAVVGGLLTYRTYTLTGLPTIAPGMLVGLWQRLDFEVYEQISLLKFNRMKDLADVPSICWDFLFDPIKLPHVLLTWTGNYWLVLTIMSIFPGVKPHIPSGQMAERIFVALIPLFLVTAFFALVYNNNTRGGDGNYYMFPLILLCLLSWATLCSKSGARAGFLVGFAVVTITLHLVISFYTSFWYSGTRAWDWNFMRFGSQTPDLRSHVLHKHGLIEIRRYLDSIRSNNGLRVVGFGDEDVMRWLPVRYESLRLMSRDVAKPTSTAQHLWNYFRRHQIEYLIMPKVRHFHPVQIVADWLLHQPETILIKSRFFFLYDFSGVPKERSFSASEKQLPKILDRASFHPGENDMQNGTRWVKHVLRHYCGQGSLYMPSGGSAELFLQGRSSGCMRLFLQVGSLPVCGHQANGDGMKINVCVRLGDGRLVVERQMTVGIGEYFQHLDVKMEPNRDGVIRIHIQVSDVGKLSGALLVTDPFLVSCQ